MRGGLTASGCAADAIGAFAARSTIATVVAMTSTVTLAAAAVGAIRSLRAIAKRAVRARLGALGATGAAGGRVGGAVEGAIVAIGAVQTRPLGRWIEEGGRGQGLRSRRGPRLRTEFYAWFAAWFTAWLRSRFGARGGRCRRGFPLHVGRRVTGGFGRGATRGPTTARSRRLVGRSRRRRRHGILRRGRRRCIEIRIVVPTGIGGRRGTGAAAANGAFAFGHSKTASGTVGSVPIWKGARRRRRHEDMRCNRPNVRCPCRARDARRARILRVALDG